MFDLHLTSRRVGITLALIGWMSSATPPVYCQTGPQSSSQNQGGLTLADRIGYQRATEEVYWRHRIWPKANAKAKPALDEAMSVSAMREKVEDYLSKSQALAVYWQRPITGEQLQAEMERMARQTKQPAMLAELWAALRNDPYVIAECLVRPALANRLIRNWYAHDERYQGELKRRAEQELLWYRTPQEMPKMSGEYQEMKWVKQEGAGDSAGGDSLLVRAAGNAVMKLSPEQWETKVGEMAQQFGVGTLQEWPAVAAIRDGRAVERRASVESAEVDRLPVGELSRLQEDEERFYVTAVLDKSSEQVSVATVEWRKPGFASWWGQVRNKLEGQPIGATAASPEQEARYGYRLPALRSGTCDDDTWTATLGPLISARYGHTAVWTGSEMIVWGGYGGGVLNTGGRYDPATDTWTATATDNAPGRSGHTAVWTGSEMIVWGGALTNTGGRYDPATDTWTATSTSNAPSVRGGHTAVWTGSEMIVWGGEALLQLPQHRGTLRSGQRHLDGNGHGKCPQGTIPPHGGLDRE